MAELRSHTRFDLMEISRRGQEFLEGARRQQGLSGKLAEVRAWLSLLERLVQDQLDAGTRMDLQEGLDVLRTVFGGQGGIISADLLATLMKTLRAIDALRSSSFVATVVSNEMFERI